MKTRFCLLVVAGLLLAGCQTGPKERYGRIPPPPPPPPRNEFAWSVGNGPNAVEGAGVWRRNGHFFSCAGQSVGLTPETPYTRERMLELYGSDEQAIRSMEEVRARYTKPKRDVDAYVRSTQCDAHGRFAFHGVPSGGWFIITHGASSTGASDVALLRVHVSGGETRAVKIGG
jgi:hypothetical protein